MRQGRGWQEGGALELDRRRCYMQGQAPCSIRDGTLLANQPQAEALSK